MHELNDGKTIKSPRRARGPSKGLPIRDLAGKQLTALGFMTVCNLGALEAPNLKEKTLISFIFN